MYGYGDWSFVKVKKTIDNHDLIGDFTVFFLAKHDLL